MIEILSNFTGLWWIFLCGDVEMHDLIFTTEGLTGGAILVEWNSKAAPLVSGTTMPASEALWARS